MQVTGRMCVQQQRRSGRCLEALAEEFADKMTNLVVTLWRGCREVTVVLIQKAREIHPLHKAWLHEKTERVMTEGNMDFCLCLTTPKCKGVMFWPLCPVFSMEFLLFDPAHVLNRLVKMQEITLPVVLCTQNMLIAIKKFPAFLNARYK